MNLRDYIRALDKDQQGVALQRYASRIPTTVGYLKTHVVCARKPASLRFMRSLANASEGDVSLTEVLIHYGVSREELEVA